MTTIEAGNITHFFRRYLRKHIGHLEVMSALQEGLPWYISSPSLEPIQAAMVKAVFGFNDVIFLGDVPLVAPYEEIDSNIQQCINNQSIIHFANHPLQLSNLPDFLREPVLILPSAEQNTAVLCSTADQGHGRWVLRWRRLFPNSGAMQLLVFDFNADHVYLTLSSSKASLFADLLADLATILSAEAIYVPEQRLQWFREMAYSDLSSALL